MKNILNNPKLTDSEITKILSEIRTSVDARLSGKTEVVVSERAKKVMDDFIANSNVVITLLKDVTNGGDGIKSTLGFFAKNSDEKIIKTMPFIFTNNPSALRAIQALSPTKQKQVLQLLTGSGLLGKPSTITDEIIGKFAGLIDRKEVRDLLTRDLVDAPGQFIATLSSLKNLSANQLSTVLRTLADSTAVSSHELTVLLKAGYADLFADRVTNLARGTGRSFTPFAELGWEEDRLQKIVMGRAELTVADSGRRVAAVRTFETLFAKRHTPRSTIIQDTAGPQDIGAIASGVAPVRTVDTGAKQFAHLSPEHRYQFGYKFDDVPIGELRDLTELTADMGLLTKADAALLRAGGNATIDTDLVFRRSFHFLLETDLLRPGLGTATAVTRDPTVLIVTKLVQKDVVKSLYPVGGNILDATDGGRIAARIQLLDSFRHAASPQHTLRIFQKIDTLSDTELSAIFASPQTLADFIKNTP